MCGPNRKRSARKEDHRDSARIQGRKIFLHLIDMHTADMAVWMDARDGKEIRIIVQNYNKARSKGQQNTHHGDVLLRVETKQGKAGTC